MKLQIKIALIALLYMSCTNRVNSTIDSTLIISEYDIIVSKDNTGNFNTVQEAINSVPDFRKVETKILIKSGNYKEKLILPACKTNVVFIGEDKMKTIISYDDYAQKKNKYGEDIGTSGSSGFFIFGDGFRATDITFQNTAGPVGQAVAVRIDGDKIVFNNCRFLGNQDTLYPHGRNSRQYYKNCYIEGTVDFIFGWSTAYFEDCEIYAKGKGYITAASTEKTSDYGFVFNNCTVKGDAENTFYLGRPWRDYAQTVWLNCTFDHSIKPEGWHNWGKENAEKTSFYAEYNSMGPGGNLANRVSWSKILSKTESQEFSKGNVLSGDDGWTPSLEF